ncbi:MAG TPA: sigma-70 family RNA polymerase sigma factor [Gemmatales bacterium]|nr:sigma-70 family RNA polymerase sigma factor [Gemmatales bacterium]
MSNPLISILMKQTQHLMRQHNAVSDGELLHQYVMLRDQAGFAGLVRRHGPMVWSVCRNALRTESDAEDAFQATFLALVRSAKSIRNRESLGAWLHGVAVRICLKSRLSTSRRLARETKVAVKSSAEQPALTWHDDIVKVHESINNLPKRERDVFVLAVLEGLAQAEVARQLGLQVNSVSGLLSRARKRLQTQLKTSEALSIVALTVVVSAQAHMPAALFTQACRLALSTSGVSVPVLALTASLTEVSMRKSLLIAMLPVLLGTGMVGGTFLLPSSNAQQAQAQPKNDPAAEYPAYGQSQGMYYSVPLNPAQKWEYKTIRRSAEVNITDAEMNTLGDQGWELSGVNTGNSANQVVYIFKRPKLASATKYTASTDQGYRATFTEGASREKKFSASPGSDQEGLYTEKKEWYTEKKPSAAAEYRAFHLQRANAGDLAEVLNSTFSLKNVITDSSTNSLHIQCETKMMKEIERFIQKLDGTKETSGKK